MPSLAELLPQFETDDILSVLIRVRRMIARMAGGERCAERMLPAVAKPSLRIQLSQD